MKNVKVKNRYIYLSKNGKNGNNIKLQQRITKT